MGLDKLKEKHPKLAKFIEEKVPHLKDAIAKLPLPGLLGTIKDMIFKDKSVSAVTKEEFNEKEAEFELEMAKVELEKFKAENDLIKEQVSQVNQTMREEAKSEHWMQWAWRPTIGFTVALMFISNYIALPYFKNYGLLPVEIPSEAWLMLGGILGLASYFRGKAKLKKGSQ